MLNASFGWRRGDGEGFMRHFPSSFEVRLPIGAIAVGALVFCMGAGEASAASLGGAVTSVGVVATLATLLLVKGWQSHFGAGGLSTLAGLLALATGAGLLWRSGAVGSLRGLMAAHPVFRTVRADATSPERRRPIVLPAGVERAALLDELRRHFFDLQSAWEQGARDAMGRLTTPDMLEELCAASSAGAGSAQRSEFVTVSAELLLFEERGAAQVVCVEYSGMVREAPAGQAAPFREFWMLTRSADRSAGWRLARHQGLF